MKKSEQGAAMVLALLVLMFFVGISMNMFFIAEKRAKKSGDRVIGSRALSVVDSGSNLGLYEVRTAFRYVRGDLTTAQLAAFSAATGGINFNNPAENVHHITAVQGNGITSNYIRTSFFHEFFTCYEVDRSGYGAASPPAALADTSFLGSTTPSAMSRIWWRTNDTPTTITRSIGGYNIVPGTGSSHNLILSQNATVGTTEGEIGESYNTAGTGNTAIKTYFRKQLRINTIGQINRMDFEIIYNETANLLVNGTSSNRTITEVNVEDITVRNID